MSQAELVNSLKKLLADSYAIYLKTHNYHWNVTGENFFYYHKMLEEQYTELATAVDVIAEMIRQKGELAPGSFEEFQQLTSLISADSSLKSLDMLKDLAKDHDSIMQSLHQGVKLAEKLGDEIVNDLFIERMEFHSKTKWMLESHWS